MQQQPRLPLCGLTIALSAVVAHAGPYPGFKQTSDPDYRGIEASDARITQWASTVVAHNPAPESSGSASNVLGDQANNSTYSLGDLTATQIENGNNPGSITLGFQRSITNATGPDLAVYENGGDFFGSNTVTFAELAYVEVSTDGNNFARFPSDALNDESDLNTNFGRSFAGVDTTNLYNLAGKYGGRTGTGFDLAELSDHTLVQAGTVDLNDINYVRIVDIPGDGSFTDAEGHPIYDAWPTTGTGGFDMTGLGVLNAAPEPSAAVMLMLGGAGLITSRGRRR